MAVEAAYYHGVRARRHPDDYPPKIRGLIEDWSIDAGHAICSRRRITCPSSGTEMRTCVRRYLDNVDYTGDAEVRLRRRTTTGDPAFNSPWSYLGFPDGLGPVRAEPDGLPLAVQLVGGSWCEDDLLAVSVMLEETIGFDHRLPPVP